jgi:hypothetical protein
VLAASALAVLAAGCATSDDQTAATPTATTTPAPTPVFTGEARRVAAAVHDFGVALDRGEVERICAPNAVVTAAAITNLDQDEGSCEQYADGRLENTGPISLAATSIKLRTDLALADVRRRDGTTVALTLLKDRRRWLLSFSDLEDPLSAILGTT